MTKKHLHLRLQSILQNVRKSKMTKYIVPVSRAAALSVAALCAMIFYSILAI